MKETQVQRGVGSGWEGTEEEAMEEKRAKDKAD